MSSPLVTLLACLSDAVALLAFLFGGGKPHSLAVPGAELEACVRILDCPDACRE